LRAMMREGEENKEITKRRREGGREGGRDVTQRTISAMTSIGVPPLAVSQSNRARGREKGREGGREKGREAG